MRNGKTGEVRRVIVGAFPGAHVTKTRPAVVLSTDDYHRHRPGVVAALITTKTPEPLAPTDCALRDWRQAGLRAQSYFAISSYSIPARGPADRKTFRLGLGIGAGVYQGWAWVRVVLGTAIALTRYSW
jgi:hypothetical protein